MTCPRTLFRSQSMTPGVVNPVIPTRMPRRRITVCGVNIGAPEGSFSRLALTTRKEARRSDSRRNGTPKLKS